MRCGRTRSYKVKSFIFSSWQRQVLICLRLPSDPFLTPRLNPDLPVSKSVLQGKIRVGPAGTRETKLASKWQAIFCATIVAGGQQTRGAPASRWRNIYLQNYSFRQQCGQSVRGAEQQMLLLWLKKKQVERKRFSPCQDKLKTARYANIYNSQLILLCSEYTLHKMEMRLTHYQLSSDPKS